MTNVRFNRTQGALALAPRAVATSGLVTIAVDTATDGALLELNNGVTLQGVKITDDVGIEKNGVATHAELAVFVRCRNGNAGTVAHQNSSMSAAHRIRVVRTAADVAVAGDSLVLLLYSTTESRWLAYDLQHDNSGDIAAAIATHEAASNPHPVYTTASEAAAAAPVQSVAGKTGVVTLVPADAGADASGTASGAVAAHVAAGDPHPQYTTTVEAAAAAPVQSVNSSTGAVVLTASSVGADASGTASAAVASHVAASNPHTQYARATRYSGTTAGSGTYSVTFGAAYSNTPNVQAQLVGGSVNQFVLVTSRSTTGFTVTAYTRTVTTLLGVDILTSAAATVNGLTIDVLVTSND